MLPDRVGRRLVADGAFVLAPDHALLYGIAAGLARGQLHPRAVPLHNALHRFWGPLALIIVTATAGLPHAWLAAALAWAFHIAFDRARGCACAHPTASSEATRRHDYTSARDTRSKRRTAVDRRGLDGIREVGAQNARNE